MSVGAFFNKVAGRQASDFISKSLQHGFFLVSDAKFLRASTYFEEHMQAMLLLKACWGMATQTPFVIRMRR